MLTRMVSSDMETVPTLYAEAHDKNPLFVYGFCQPLPELATLDALMLTCEPLAELLAKRQYWHHLERARPTNTAKMLILLHEDIPGTLSVYLCRHLRLHLLA